MLLKIIILNSILLCRAKTEQSDKHCSKLLNNLAASQSNLLSCITRNSVPVTMCIGCKNEYMDVLKTYDTLINTCSGIYFDQDRINLVPTTEAVLTGLWSRAYCDDCFNNNNSQTFYEKYQTFMDCRSQQHDNPCEACKNEYMALNTFYTSLDRYNNGEVCFDLQDSMNRTRNEWSKKLNCCVRKYNVLYFSIALCVISCLTLLFYFSSYLLTKRQERSHGILSDEDAIFTLPPSSLPNVGRLNISNNPPMQTDINRRRPSTNEIRNIPEFTSKSFESKNNAKAACEDDSSDEEMLISS